MTLGRFWLVMLLLVAGFLFTYKLMMVPPGIETDEGAIAHNAALIAKTGRDQNGRFLPFFILSSDKIDWKQPVLIYLSAIVFKIFGASLTTFKLVNVFLSLLSVVLMWFVLHKLFSDKFALSGVVVLITTPMIVIASRMGNEGIDPVLFSAAWLLALCLFRRTGKVIYIAMAALALGFGFYSYKGMRLIVPPWVMVTTLYIFWRSLQNSDLEKTTISALLKVVKQTVFNKKFIINLLTFIIFLSPFFLITPILEQKYPGAVFDRRTIGIESYRHVAYYWLSNLDFGFLYGKGEIGKIFSVELYGVYLLSTLPLFLIGVKKACEKISFFTFIVACYLGAPMLFDLAGSFGYGHRLVAMIPLYIVIVTLGIQSITDWVMRWKGSKLAMHRLLTIGVTLTLISFFIFNFSDFFAYYFFEYPKLNETKISFSNNLDAAYYKLAKLAKTSGLQAYVQDDIHYSHGEGNQFFEVAYFDEPVKIWKLGQELPSHSALLTQVERLDEAKNSGLILGPLHILESE